MADERFEMEDFVDEVMADVVGNHDFPRELIMPFMRGLKAELAIHYGYSDVAPGFREELKALIDHAVKNKKLPAYRGDGFVSKTLHEAFRYQEVLRLPGGYVWKNVPDIENIERDEKEFGAKFSFREDFLDPGEDEIPDFVAYLVLFDSKSRKVGSLSLRLIDQVDAVFDKKAISKKAFSELAEKALGFVGPRLVIGAPPMIQMDPGEHFTNEGLVVFVDEKGFLHREDGPAFIYEADEQDEADFPWFNHGKPVKKPRGWKPAKDSDDDYSNQRGINLSRL